jgi:hypothetical protein
MRAGDDAERGNDEVGAPPACSGERRLGGARDGPVRMLPACAGRSDVSAPPACGGAGTTHLWGKERS